MATGQDFRNHQSYREKQVKKIPEEIGVYALCDLDNVPIYVGQSVDGIRARVRRHLTSARSDIIANRLVDVWEIAYVRAWPVDKEDKISKLEAHLFHQFDAKKRLMNGTIPMQPPNPLPFKVPEKTETQILPEEERLSRIRPALRFPRQIEHLGRLVDQILVVKDSKELHRALVAHFERLKSYYNAFKQ